MSKSECQKFQQLIVQFMQDSITSEDEISLLNHLETCESCAGSFSKFAFKETKQEITESFIPEIMVHTSGIACEDCQNQISENYDYGTQKPSEDFYSHLKHCPDCRSLSLSFPKVMKAVSEEELWQPDSLFTADVLYETSSSEFGIALAWGRKILNGFDSLILNRPRIAIEIAYALTVMLLILVQWTGIPEIRADKPSKLTHEWTEKVLLSTQTEVDSWIDKVRYEFKSQKHRINPLTVRVESRGRAFATKTGEEIRARYLAIRTSTQPLLNFLTECIFPNKEEPCGK